MTGKEVVYKGYTIKPKKDFGSYGYLINGKTVRKGFVVVNKRNINIMPGATWFLTIEEARIGINVLIKYGEKGFWKGWKIEGKKINIENQRTIKQLKEQICRNAEYNDKVRERIKRYRERISELESKIYEAENSLKPVAGLNGTLSTASKVNATAVGAVGDSLAVKVNGKWKIPYYKEGQDFQGIPKLRDASNEEQKIKYKDTPIWYDDLRHEEQHVCPRCSMVLCRNFTTKKYTCEECGTIYEED